MSEHASTTPLRVAFLIGADTAATRMSIEAVCQVENIVPAAVLLDTHVPSRSVRWRNLRRNMRRHGIGYIFRRALLAIRESLDRRAARLIPASEIDTLLRAAFPERCFSLSDLGRRYGFAIHEIGNLNGAAAAARLRHTGAKLGIVLGTRVLKRSTFSVPEFGCINLHKGKVPEYRGMPPGFWELYERAPSAGVTVHFVDDGLDTGDIIATSEFPIHPKETVSSLRTKLDHEGARVLATAVSGLQRESIERRPQPRTASATRTKPTRMQELELSRRAPHLAMQESDLKRLLKTAFHLLLFRSGIFSLVRAHRRRRGRGAIILYHRVNDVSNDNLTTSTRVFAEHLLVLKRYYCVLPSSAIVRNLSHAHRVQSGTAAIHFDDCYRDVYLNAGPLLGAAGLSATMFIATGFVDTDRSFLHDQAKYPHAFENLRGAEIPLMIDHYGFEVGAHTVNHVDLGAIDLCMAEQEVTGSKSQLERFSGRPVSLFSFPFGRRTNIRPEIRDIVRKAGFDALFSAHGGFLKPNTDLFNIPRLGAHSQYRALDLIMELEGLSLSQMFGHLRRRLPAS